MEQVAHGTWKSLHSMFLILKRVDLVTTLLQSALPAISQEKSSPYVIHNHRRFKRSVIDCSFFGGKQGHLLVGFNESPIFVSRNLEKSWTCILELEVSCTIVVDQWVISRISMGVPVI